MIRKQTNFRNFPLENWLDNYTQSYDKIFSGSWEEIHHSFGVIKIWTGFSHVIDL